MKSIYKYDVTPVGITMMPKGAEILSVGTQRGGIVVWALVEVGPVPPDVVPRGLVPVPTGHAFQDEDAPKTSQFIGTVQIPNGLVFHIFDTGER